MTGDCNSLLIGMLVGSLLSAMITPIIVAVWRSWRA